MKYGSFIGDADPVKGDDSGNSPTMLLEYALDRIADEMLTQEQIVGVVRFAHDAVVANG